MARGSRFQHRSSSGTNLRVETALGVKVRGATHKQPRRRGLQDGKDNSPLNRSEEVRASCTYLKHFLNTQKDSENEQQSDVDMVGADAGRTGQQLSGTPVGTTATSVSGEKQKAQEEAKRLMERIQSALTHLGSGDVLKDVRETQSRAVCGEESLRRHGCRGKLVV